MLRFFCSKERHYTGKKTPGMGCPHSICEIHCELELEKDLKCILNGEH